MQSAYVMWISVLDVYSRHSDAGNWIERVDHLKELNSLVALINHIYLFNNYDVFGEAISATFVILSSLFLDVKQE